MSNGISSIQSTYSSSIVGSIAANGANASADVGSASAYAVELSQPGQLFSQLQSLAQSNPDEFKEVAANIASQLKDAAASQSGRQADLLDNLATRFQAASQSGSFSDLTPPARQSGTQASAQHHHHHHLTEAAGGDQPSTSPPSGAESAWSTIQGIISNALSAVSTG